MRQDADFRELLLLLPKTEIHLHLEALATVETIWSLMQKYNIHYDGVETKEDLVKKFQIKTLNEFIFVFINIVQNSFKEEKDFMLLLADAGEYLKNNNIVYAEIFFAPTKFLQAGFKYYKIAETLTSGAYAIKQKYGVDIRFLIDVSRTFGAENAMKNLKALLKFRTQAIIGIGLGGSESAGPAKDYAKVYELARKNQLRTVAHCGEDLNAFSIWDSIEHLKMERVGHGTSAFQDEKLLDFLAENQMPIEVCPTSNIFTKKFVQKIENHPVRSFFDKGLNVTINSDDPTLFSTSLIDEYMLLYKSGVFSKEEIFKLIKNNIYATFLPIQEKNAIWQENLALIESKTA